MTDKERQHDRDRIAGMLRYKENSDYLRQRLERYIDKIRGGDTGGGHKGDAPTGMVREQASADDFEWHPGLDLS